MQANDYPVSSFDVYGPDHRDYTRMNSTKLQNYIDLVIHVKIRTQDGSKDIYRPYRNCKITDFTKYGYEADEAFKDAVADYFCPDLDNFDLYRIESKYTN